MRYRAHNFRTTKPRRPAGRSRGPWRWLGLLLGAVLLLACEQMSPLQRPGAGPPAAVPAGVVPVQVQRTARGFQLLRGGQPYFLRGGAGLQHFEQLRAAGGNTVRLYGTDYAAPILDSAQRQGLSVMLGIWLEQEGQYFSYYDPAMVRAQLARVRRQVLRFRHHPALLMWSVGNELELGAKGPRVYEAINGIAEMIHELDPHHPVTTALTYEFVYRAQELQKVAPAVDILSINIYGRMKTLPALLKESGWKGPYIVSEYGTPGYWQGEANYTAWLSAIEQTSAAKAEFVSSSYRQVIEQDTTHCLGSYVFYWGTKFEYSPTWLSLFEPTGEKTEVVDELHRLWRGRYPPNRAPHLTELRLAGETVPDRLRLQAGQAYPARVRVTDPEADSLTLRWEMLPDTFMPDATSKVVETPPEPVPGCVVQAAGPQALIRMPRQPGRYRLFVRVFDGHGSVATANLPLLVGAAPVAAAPRSN